MKELETKCAPTLIKFDNLISLKHLSLIGVAKEIDSLRSLARAFDIPESIYETWSAENPLEVIGELHRAFDDDAIAAQLSGEGVEPSALSDSVSGLWVVGFSLGDLELVAGDAVERAKKLLVAKEQCA